MKRNLTYVFSICFILFFTFSTSARDCPPEKPFQDVRGNCYSCDDSRTFIKYPKSVKSGLEELEYNGNCTDVCPNRIEYRDGWLDAPYFCDKNTLKNKLNAYIVKNAMSILFNPINWINFFIICFSFPLFLLRIFKKDKNIALKIIIPVFMVIPSLALSFYYFLNNWFITVFGIFLIVLKNKLKKKNS